MSFDDIDLSIIEILKDNSKLSFKEIGEKIHLTGQAVGTRVNKLIDMGIIEGFTININKEKLGVVNTSYIKIYMTSYNHDKMQDLINECDKIVEAYRISSDGCYLLRVETINNEDLDKLLTRITTFANYQVSMCISKLK